MLKHFIHAQSYMKKTLCGIAYCINCMFICNRNIKRKGSWIRQKSHKDLWKEKRQSKQIGVFKEFQIPTQTGIQE